jgi:hypothetical protein
MASVRRSTSGSSLKAKQRDAQRLEERAVRHDQQAARYAADMASKRRALLEAERRLSEVEASERRRATVEAQRNELSIAPVLPANVARRQPVASVSPAEYEGADPSGEGVATTDERASDRAVARRPSLAEETNVDAVLELGRAGVLGALSGIPVVGPVLGELVGTAWPDLRFERLERFARALDQDVRQLEDRIDHDFVRHSEFAALAEEAIERVVQRRNSGKVARFAAAVAHSATTERPDQRQRERFLDWLHDLRPIHLEILAELVKPNLDWTRPGDIITVGQVAESRLSAVLARVGADRVDLAELRARGLVGSLDDSGTLLNVANDVTALVTPLGIQFLSFVTSENRKQGLPMGSHLPIDAS